MKKYIWLAALTLFTAQGAQAMGRIPKKEYDAKVAELEALKKQCALDQQASSDKIKSLDEKIAALETKSEQLLSDMESSKDQSQKKLAEIMRQKEELEKEKAAEIDRLKSTYDNLVGDMQKEIEQGSIQITQLQDKLSVTLVDKVVFNSGESEVNEQGKQVLKKVAKILKTVKNKQIRIEGHTDNVPIGGALKEKFPSNWELSTARATAVSRYLQDAGEIDPNILIAAGYSQYRPVADNGTVEGRSKNRRIEIALIPMEISAATPPAPAATPAKGGKTGK